MKQASCYLLVILGSLFGYSLGRNLQGLEKNDQHVGIYNGQNTKIEKYPFMTSLHLDENVVGSGVVLNEKWILTTAAHIYGYTTTDLKFQVATNTINDFNSGMVYEVDKILMHENFTFMTYDYDIALVKVTKQMKFGKKLSNATLGNSTLKKKSTATVLGWGRTSQGDDNSKYLQNANVTVMDWNKCHLHPYEITSRQICTYDLLTGPCTNDYGSPLVVDGVVYALFSRSTNCIPGQSPIVYTDVSQFLDWIQNTIANN